MKNFSSSEEKVRRQRLGAGLAYGMIAGLAFAGALWGYDDYLLAQHHGLLPWTKLIIGGLLSMAVCGLAGWLTMRFEKVALAFLFWAIAARLLAWFTLIVPFTLTPAAIGLLRPEIKPYLSFIIYPNMGARITVLFAWILIASIITAAIQIPMVDQAVFSTSAGNKILPLLACIFFFGVVGSFADSLNNQALREPVIQLDNSLQFWLNTRGTQVDRAAAREHRLASLRLIENQITPSYRLLASGNDELIEFIPIIVRFDTSLAQCDSVVGNVLTCKPLPE